MGIRFGGVLAFGYYTKGVLVRESPPGKISIILRVGSVDRIAWSDPRVNISRSAGQSGPTCNVTRVSRFMTRAHS